MKNYSQKQLYILQRFAQLNQIPTNSENTANQKKIILLKNIYTEQKCIMKVQPKQILDNRERNILHQASFYQKFQGHSGVPLMIWSGQDFECLVLILEELGLKVHDRMKFSSSNKKMRIKDACMIGIQIIDIIKNFHEKDYLHKNITPQTFSFGRNERITKLYANDLLYMKKFRGKNNLNHIQEKQRVRLEFLTPFLSKNILNGKQASRRDDIISIMYVVIYLIKGKLPWQEDWEQQISLKRQQISQINEKQQVNFVFQLWPKQSQDISSKAQRMKKIQQSVTSEQLCQNIPRQVKVILDLVHELDFTQEPQYYRYISLLKKALFRQKMKNDSVFQWMQSIQVLQSSLKAEANVLRIQTYKQKALESIVYEPFEHKVNFQVSQEHKLRRTIKNAVYTIQSEQLNQNQTFERKSNFPFKKKHHCQII